MGKQRVVMWDGYVHIQHNNPGREKEWGPKKDKATERDRNESRCLCPHLCLHSSHHRWPVYTGLSHIIPPRECGQVQLSSLTDMLTSFICQKKNGAQATYFMQMFQRLQYKRFHRFTIARTWKQPRCPTADEWSRKLWYIHTMDHYSAMKKNSFESVLMGWMTLEPII